MTDIAPVRRALISVSDKTGLEALGKRLATAGVELISTGGTAKALRAAGLAVKDVAELTQYPEMMDGRVKTLHPVVHGGLLAVRANPDHVAAMAAHGIAAIDLLVVNLYPFEATVARGADYDECVENIDIGGPAMIRAAAKNHADVAVVVDAEDYDAVLAEIEAGGTSLATRKRLAATAYARTAAYDAAVSGWMAAAIGQETPRRRAFAGTLAQGLRYGENPHQRAAFYAETRSPLAASRAATTKSGDVGPSCRRAESTTRVPSLTVSPVSVSPALPVPITVAVQATVPSAAASRVTVKRVPVPTGTCAAT